MSNEVRKKIRSSIIAQESATQTVKNDSGSKIAEMTCSESSGVQTKGVAQ